MRGWRHDPKRRRHLLGLVRASAYVGIVALVALLLGARAARAELANKALTIGRTMAELARARVHDGSKVTLNGQVMYLGSSVSTDTPNAVLDRYEAYCRSALAQPGSSWSALASKAAAVDADKAGLLASAGVLRSGGEREGNVLCFTKSSRSKPTLEEAFKAFGETGDFGALGSVRYVYAYQGARGSTVVLSGWTDESFDVSALVGDESKDAPGTDFPEIPRLPGATRSLAADVEGVPFALNAYRTRMAPAEAVAFYDRAMQEAGWLKLDPELARHDHDAIARDDVHARLYEKDGVVLTLVGHAVEGGAQLILGLAGVSAQDAPPAGVSRF